MSKHDIALKIESVESTLKLKAWDLSTMLRNIFLITLRDDFGVFINQ